MLKSEEMLYLENQLCFPLYATSRLTTKVYGPYLQDLNLTYPQYLVMMVLWEEDGLNVGEISKKLHLETNTLTPLLNRMEAKALIQKIRSKDDERQVIIKLLPSGEALKEKALSIPEKILASFNGSELSIEELKTFQKTLFRLLHGLESQLDG